MGSRFRVPTCEGLDQNLLLQLLLTMNELKEKLKAIGLSEEMTDKAIVTVAEFVKTKIPQTYHTMIDDVMAGKAPEMGGILGSITGLFGKK